MKPEELKTARAKMELSQPEMAERLGMGERTYLQRESGDMPISKTMEYAICWLLFLDGWMVLIQKFKLGGISKMRIGTDPVKARKKKR